MRHQTDDEFDGDAGALDHRLADQDCGVQDDPRFVGFIAIK
jgi:hypothetical protein